MKMPPDVHLITVPHTGTNSMMRCLQDAGVRYRHHHTNDRHIAWYILEAGLKCVVTLRDPMRQIISSLNRGEALCTQDWHKLAHYAHKDVCFFRVDAPDGQRAAEEEKLARFLGKPAPFPWTTHYNSKPDATGLHAQYSETGRMGEFFERGVSERAVQFFREHGYELPWMAGRGHG